MNFDGDLIRLGTCDVSLLKKRVLEFTEDDWLEEQGRQKQFEVHRHTQTIRIVGNDESANITPVLLPRYADFANLLNPLFLQMSALFPSSGTTQIIQGGGQSYPVNVLFVKLLPGGKISPHMDSGFVLTHSHRVHIPLQTTENTLFSVGDSTVNMKEGEIWEINNRRLHAVDNMSDAERIHMIIDWRIREQSCCCGSRIHPGAPCTPENCESGPYLCSCYTQPQK